MNNKGFSLVELSIVLIILGMMVAGVTGGASLIKSAKINKICNQMIEYKRAYNTYYARFGKPAGYDSSGDWSSRTVAEDLYKAGIIGLDNIYDNIEDGGGAICPGGYSGSSGCVGIAFVFTDFEWVANSFSEYGENTHFLSTTDGGTIECNKELGLAIDTKLDDGNPKTGIIRPDGSDSENEDDYVWGYLSMLIEM